MDKGEWVRREQLVDELVEENPSSDREFIEECVDDLIYDLDLIDRKEVDGEEYVKLISTSKATMYLAQAKFSLGVDKLKHRLFD